MPMPNVGYGGNGAPNNPNDPRQPNEPSSKNSTKGIVKQQFEGNYVVNVPVPDGVFRRATIDKNKAKELNAEEFQYVRYSAVTCDPNEFIQNNFKLRQQIYGEKDPTQKRETELFIVLTMYNEDKFLFSRSMIAVLENIKNMCSEDRFKSQWGPNGWQRIVVCIVSDGREKINKQVLQTIGIMGAYNGNVMKDEINGKEVQAHVFEYTSQLFLNFKKKGDKTEIEQLGTLDGYFPVQILFCLKEKNKKKINSHRWFFNAFGAALKPNVCVLIDVGTRPSPHSIYQLWKAFHEDKQVAGACGEIRCDTGGKYSPYVWKNPLVAAQHFEYKMSNILDKPLESVFGYISVLPGAFSAYRYEALQGKPLEAYFKGEKIHEQADSGLSISNMYLAEDRILCFELVAKKENNYILKYVRQAHADTDVPDNVPEFISQRRRWLNGSFFASVYSIRHWKKVYSTEHSLGRKISFSIEFLYNVINLLFSWFGMANFFLTFYFLAGSVKNNAGATGITILDEHGSTIFIIMETIYAYAMICIFTCSLGNKPQGSRYLYLACIILFALVMLFMLTLSGITIYQVLKVKPKDETFDNPNLWSMIFSLLATYGLYLICSVMYLKPWHMFNAFVQYMLLLPSFTNILMVYAFCNTHDVSWGTKGSTEATTTKLGSVNAKPGDQVVIDGIVSTEKNNQQFDEMFNELQNATKKEEKEKNEQDIEYKKQNFRTNMVLFWIFCNSLLLIGAITIFDDEYLLQNNNFNPYLTFIFYSVLGLSAIRFVGSTIYIIEDSSCCKGD
ncbi:chitin synthase-domain-containing protein [Neocallimastix sp. 'constans']